MDKYKVRINAKFNAEQVLEIYRAEKWWGRFSGDVKVLKKAISGTYAFACLYHNNNIVAVGRVSSDGISDAYIHDVAVKKEYRGRGLGKKVVDALLKHVKSKGIDWIVLIAQPGTEKFWKKMGFKVMRGHVPLKYKNE